MSIESADNILHVKNSTMRISRVEVGQTLSVGNIEFDTTTTLASVTSNGNNTTPHTISSSNVTTGLVTTANVVVGGDLIVGGTSLVNAIYPVGTLIDRATAITDTHPNGKYKAFLAAPNQEWELLPSYTSAIEQLTAVCNENWGTTSLYGRATIQNVTTIQALSTTDQVFSGSVVENYTPPVGTVSIVYNFRFNSLYDPAASSVYFHTVLQYKEGDGNWTNVNAAKRSSVGYQDYNSGPIDIEWVFRVNASNNSDYGTFAAARPRLSFRWLGREQSSTQQAVLHDTYNASGGGFGGFKPPQVSLTALGTESTLKYKRSV